jgi:NAD(P)H-dependent FMN reductase
MKILAIVGSLRATSSNHIVTKYVSNLIPAGVEFAVYDGLAGLPHFDDSNEISTAVESLRRQIKEADVVFICTPEYAFGIPGSLKNALDWTVGSGEFVDKPVALVTASSVGNSAHAALLLTLSAISAKMIEGGTLLIPFIRAKIKEGEIADAETKEALQKVVTSLLKF